MKTKTRYVTVTVCQALTRKVQAVLAANDIECVGGIEGATQTAMYCISHQGTKAKKVAKLVWAVEGLADIWCDTADITYDRIEKYL